MRIQNSFWVFILPVCLATIYSLLLIRVRGESCGALTIAEPGDDAATLREKAFANFRQSCRKKKSNPVEETYASCGAYVKAGKSRGNGYYSIAGDCMDGSRHDPIQVYCDQNSNGGGWMRFYYKPGNGSCTKYEEFTWTGELIRCLGLDASITGFAVSDDITTINTTRSWILSNGKFHKFVQCLEASCQTYQPMTIPKEDIIANLANCNTPTGTMWSKDYDAAYAYVRGILSTNGDWQTMYLGCGAQYVNINNVVEFRFGGTLDHTGEFIHTRCKAYKIDVENSVTSLWNTDNVRAMWIKK